MAEIINNAAARPAKRPGNANNSVPLTDILYRTLHHWPWVLLSLFVCVGAGAAYLMCTPNVYTTKASILIKDESAGKTAGTEDFGDFGLFQNKTNIQNEITTLKSADLMEEVVRRLSLDMNYYTPGKFHRTVAYGTSLPVTVSMVGYPENASAEFKLAVAPDGAVTISDLKAGGIDAGHEDYTGALLDTIATPAGPMVVASTAYMAPGIPVKLVVEKTPLAATAGAYDSRLGVAISNDKGTVIDLTITDQSTQRAQELINTLIGVYNEYWIRDKNQIAVSTSNFINDRLGVIESELGNVDSDISSYKSEHLIPDIDAASSMYLSQNQQISQEILTLNNQLQLTRYIKSYLGADMDGTKLLPANTGVDNVDIQQQIGEYNALVLQHNNLLAKSSDKNPLVIQLTDQVGQMRQAILASVDNSIVALTSKIKSLQGSQASTTSKLASNPNQAKYLLSVERQQKVKESLYLFLLQKREENELSQAFTAYNTRIVNKPASFGPTAPNRTNILGICLLAGLAIPFGVIFLSETNNTKLRGRKDLENMLPPLLGEIPQVGAKGKKGVKQPDTDHEILVKPKSRNIINEAFRVLRTNTEFSRLNKQGCNVLAITSFNPGSGKSFITMNLASAIAVKDKRVLVIDGDMRHGSCSGYAPQARAGLSDYLSGNCSDAGSLLVSPGGISALQLLPIGTMPPNPAELLESPRFGRLIDEMRPRYDYIIIDCPPIEVVADAQIIDQHADRTVFVVRAGLLDRSMLAELDRLYVEKKYKHIAVVLNGTRNDQGRYGYSHTYRYGYGYGYGYGYNYESNKK